MLVKWDICLFLILSVIVIQLFKKMWGFINVALLTFDIASLQQNSWSLSSVWERQQLVQFSVALVDKLPTLFYVLTSQLHKNWTGGLDQQFTQSSLLPLTVASLHEIKRQGVKRTTLLAVTLQQLVCKGTVNNFIIVVSLVMDKYSLLFICKICTPHLCLIRTVKTTRLEEVRTP